MLVSFRNVLLVRYDSLPEELRKPADQPVPVPVQAVAPTRTPGATSTRTSVNKVNLGGQAATPFWAELAGAQAVVHQHREFSFPDRTKVLLRPGAVRGDGAHTKEAIEIDGVKVIEVLLDSRDLLGVQEQETSPLRLPAYDPRAKLDQPWTLYNEQCADKMTVAEEQEVASGGTAVTVTENE